MYLFVACESWIRIRKRYFIRRRIAWGKPLYVQNTIDKT